MNSRVWAEISLSKLHKNFDEIKRLSGGRDIASVVKMNAYGHGAVEITKRLKDKSDFFCVSTIEEAIELVESGINKPILILSPVIKSTDVREALREEIRLNIAHKESLSLIEEETRKLEKEAFLHLEIDTGMTRTGIDPDEIENILAILDNNPFLRLEGVFTHFATLPEDRKTAEEQLKLFKECISKILNSIKRPILHISNSAGVLSFDAPLFDMVRPGITLYGLLPDESMQKEIDIDLYPILSMKTKVLQLRNVKKGQGISYGHRFRPDRDIKVATLGVGYGDGYPRQMSEAEVILRGKRAKVVGTITMDLTMVDVTHIEDIKVGDTAILIGTDGNDRITATDLARWAGTINYHILTGISVRVPRIYIE